MVSILWHTMASPAFWDPGHRPLGSTTNFHDHGAIGSGPIRYSAQIQRLLVGAPGGQSKDTVQTIFIGAPGEYPKDVIQTLLV